MFVRRITLVVSLLVGFSMYAQSGHWEGVIRAPQMNVNIEVDLSRTASGEWAGTFGNAMQNVHGLPLSDIRINGNEIAFALKLTGGDAFRGTLAADGNSINGTFTTRHNDNDMELPFELTRKGDAKIEAAPKSAPISKALEGRWSGSLQVEGTTRTIGLTLTNHPDGTATGIVVSSENVQIPIASIVENGAHVKLDVKNIGGVFAGTLTADGLAGTWTQGPFSAPLTFHRLADALIDRWVSAAGGRDKVAKLTSIYREATIGTVKQGDAAWSARRARSRDRVAEDDGARRERAHDRRHVRCVRDR